MSNSKIIALFNQSGGVAKTTLTMNLGYQLAQRKHRVLLVDMDPQASLTAFMGLEPSEIEETVYESLMEGEILPIHEEIHEMDLLPANINLSGAELELVVADMRDMRLVEALKPIRDQYDFILVDCPPSLGILSYISLVAATHVLIPIQTEYKALKGTELLLQTVARVKKRANRELQVAGILPTMYDSRTVQSAQSLQSITESLGGLATVYPPLNRSIAFADAAQRHQPLAVYNSKHPAVKVLSKVAKGLETIH